MYKFSEDVIAVFGKYYLREPNTKDTIGSGIIVLLVGKGSSKGIRRGALLYWRLFPHRIYGFGTPSLAW
jgi:hypothetical protein